MMPPVEGGNRAYAKHRGCDEKSVRKARETGRITVEEGGKINFAKADAEWLANSRARGDSGGPASVKSAAKPAQDAETSQTPLDYASARARRERADAERSELDTARAAGRLVDRERVVAGVFEAFRGIRDRVLAVPRRVAPTVVNVDSVRVIELAIEDELRRALGGESAAATIAARVVP